MEGKFLDKRSNKQEIVLNLLKCLRRLALTDVN